MKIFISHSTNYNYLDELYTPLKNSELNTKHELILPHEEGKEVPIKDVIRECDLVVAEVSDPDFAQGVALGWANEAYVSIICFFKSGSKVSPALQYITESTSEYDSVDNMVKSINAVVDAL